MHANFAPRLFHVIALGKPDRMVIFNPFSFIKNKRLFISSEGFSTLEKKRPDMLSEGNATHPVGCDSPLQIVMAVWRPFCLKSNFLSRV